MKKNLKNIQTFEQHTDKNLNISDVSDILKKILKDVKSKSKKEKWFGANVHSFAYEAGKNDVIEIIEDILKMVH